MAHVIYEAARKHFEAVRDRNIANATVFLEKPAGIGEHPDLVGEFIELVSGAASAQDALNLMKAKLSKMVGLPGEPEKASLQDVAGLSQRTQTLEKRLDEILSALDEGDDEEDLSMVPEAGTEEAWIFDSFEADDT